MADNKNFRHDDGKLDQLLDNALADYSNVEPRAGLEGRILANLDHIGDSAQAEARSWLRWWPAFSFAGAAVIALVIFFLAMPHATPKPPQVVVVPPTAAAPAPTPSITIPQPPQTASISHPRTHAISRTTPPPAPAPPQLAVVKQDVFPAPSPLTEQERLLFSYLRRTPHDEIASQAREDPPSSIVDLQNRLVPNRPSENNLGK